MLGKYSVTWFAARTSRTGARGAVQRGQTQREVADQLGVSATLVNFMMRDAMLSCRAAVAAA